MNETYGYVRVSTKDQCEERQLIAMQEFGVPQKNIFTDKLSGKDFERPLYKRLLRKLRPGDLVVVKSIDRLGREKMPIPSAFYPLWEKFRRREITARAAARQLGVVHSTFLKWGGSIEKSL